MEESLMRLQKNFWRLGLAVILLMLGACSPSDQSLPPTLDTTMIFTQAAQTVAVQLTQTSAVQTAAAPAATPTLAPPDTFTPVVAPPIFTIPTGGVNQPFFTPTISLLPLGTPTSALCNNSAYVTMIGVQDGAVLKPGQKFATGWLIQNTGICDWLPGYTLVRTGGNTDFSAPPFTIQSLQDVVPAGVIAEISLRMTAPKMPGTYEAFYQMYSNLNVPFGTGMSIRIEVKK
jgi:hypothetical protein